jgi:methyltransferase (TIGR00027 family)
MHESQPSRTAQRVAIGRALHQVLDSPKVFDDPIALLILGKESASSVRSNPDQYQKTPLSPYLRAFLAARSRYAEDQLALAVTRGVSQYVVLGAGLDTFAYRNPYPVGTLHVFEVDHPATQGWKHERLEEAGLVRRSDLTFAPINFEKQSLADGLRAAGFDEKQPAFFSWLGVTPYLTRDTLMTTLGFVASMPRKSGVVFDYAIAPSLLTPTQRAVFGALSERVAASGEPFQTSFDPRELENYLRAIGFKDVENKGREEINGMYFSDRSDGLQVGGLAQLIYAGI